MMVARHFGDRWGHFVDWYGILGPCVPWCVTSYVR